MPEKTAESATKCMDVRVARMRASVVFPQPGGPHRTKLVSLPESAMRRMGPSSPRRWSCPTISASADGLRRSARGRSAKAANRLGASSFFMVPIVRRPEGKGKGGMAARLLFVGAGVSWELSGKGFCAWTQEKRKTWRGKCVSWLP